MTNLELLEILGSVQGKYILEAQQMRTGRRKARRFPYGRQLAAVIALILMMTLFLNTAPGAAAMEFVKEKVASLIETLFPPKKMSINMEGFEIEGDYVADGVEPETAGETPKPGFAIYYDENHYTMVKKGDVTYIRPCMTREAVLESYGDSLSLLTEEEREREIAALMNPNTDDSLPPCEIEITHLDLPFEQAASQERGELEEKWEIQEYTNTDRITFHMQNGYEWDSPVEQRCYISDEQDGCFRIISRYFLEATEGHGTRFAAIVGTFRVLPSQDGGKGAPVEFQTDPVTIDGYALTPDGDSVPVRLTMEVENVRKGEAAFREMVSQKAQVPTPEEGKEYILVTLKVTYEDGGLESLDFMENYPASWAAARVHFNLPNEYSNTEDVTHALAHSIWGPDPFAQRPLKRGESVTGDVAFLQNQGNTQPLYFEGYGQVVEFQVQ